MGDGHDFSFKFKSAVVSRPSERQTELAQNSYSVWSPRAISPLNGLQYGSRIDFCVYIISLPLSFNYKNTIFLIFTGSWNEDGNLFVRVPPEIVEREIDHARCRLTQAKRAREPH